MAANSPRITYMLAQVGLTDTAALWAANTGEERTELTILRMAMAQCLDRIQGAEREAARALAQLADAVAREAANIGHLDASWITPAAAKYAAAGERIAAMQDAFSVHAAVYQAATGVEPLPGVEA